MEINNFKLVGTYDHEPQYLVELETYHDFKIYRSNFNGQLRVVLNPNDNSFYAFENNGASADLDADIKIVIAAKWKPLG